MSIISANPYVQSESYSQTTERKKNEMLEYWVEDLKRNTTPENIDHLAKGAADREIPKVTPRYRGTTNDQSIINNNEGMVGLVKMNVGDFIAYTGITEGKAINGTVYQWEGKEWVLIPLNTESGNYGKYMEACMDLVRGCPDGFFARLFCESLVAVNAFITNLYTKNGVLTKGGSLQSEEVDPVTGEPLVLMTASGLLKAIRAVFKDIRITGNSYFEGDITSGQIFSSNNRIGQDLPPKTFSANQTAKDIHVYYGKGQDTYKTEDLGNFPISGKWGGRSASNVHLSTYRAGIGMSIYTQYIVEVTLNDVVPAQTVRSDWIDSSGYRDTLGVAFEITTAKSGATLRLFNVPSGDPQYIDRLLTGQVYEQGGALYIKK